MLTLTYDNFETEVLGVAESKNGIIKIKPWNALNVIAIKLINMVIKEENKDINAMNVDDNL